MFYILLIPGFIEELLSINNKIGNIALYGICLELYIKRNLFYLSLFIFFVFYIFKIYYYIFLFFVFLSFNLFANCYLKWKEILKINYM
jgi:hypothetical protein